MKKLMKKKVSLFGKEFSVFAIAVVSMMVLVSAALVPYLSLAVSGNVGVISPFETKILGSGQSIPNYDGLIGVSPVTIADVHGGEFFEVTVGFKNLADYPSTVGEKFIISGVDPATGPITSAFSCDDFASIEWYTCTDSTPGDTTHDCNLWAPIQSLDMGTECDDLGGSIVIMNPAGNPYDAGEVNVDKFVITLQPNALGTYTFSAQIVPL